MAKKIEKTNAARLLDKAGISYKLIPYEYDENDLAASSRPSSGNTTRESQSSRTTARASRHPPARSSASASAAAKERNSSYRRKHWKQENKKEADPGGVSLKKIGYFTIFHNIVYSFIGV